MATLSNNAFTIQTPEVDITSSVELHKLSTHSMTSPVSHNHSSIVLMHYETLQDDVTSRDDSSSHVTPDQIAMTTFIADEDNSNELKDIVVHQPRHSDVSKKSCDSGRHASISVGAKQLEANPRDVDLSIVFVPHMVLSCIAMWCCGCLFGCIGFGFAVAGAHFGDKGDIKKASILSTVALLMAIIGFATGLIVLVILLLMSLGVF